MPKLEEYCEVRTTGGVFRDWINVAVEQSFGNPNWMRTFRLIVAEPSEHLQLRLKPGDRVDIALAGKVVIQEGYISRRQAAIAPQQHLVQIEGYSKAGTITEASVDVPGGQFRNYSVDAIAKRVLQPYGLNFKVENGPEGWQEKFPNVSVRYGETPFDLVSRLCSQRGLWLHADESGNLIAGPKSGGGAMFAEGVNILAANCMIEMPSVASLVGSSQAQGSDSLFGKKAAEIQAKTDVSGGPKGTKRIVLAEMPLTQKELQARVNMEAAALAASQLRVSLTYQGWLNPSGSLWNLGESVTVRSPALFPIQGGQMELRLWGYVYSQDVAGGTTTTLELVNAGAFQQKYSDGQQSDSFYQAIPPAQPEQPT
ncbi:contractile injection system protein, VgrG/Pvc8 family [Methylobacterium oryzisoli]|uniref:contractile injection system protein, VgrG/Pvc8 family n=1 Tax=Methylobacterium oryzisoli TaxID=3385502 RepID=UPI0038921CB1